MATITVDQEIELSIAPKDSRGNPARVDGDPVWAISDATVFELRDGADAFTKIARPLGPISACLVTVTIDADLGEGIKPLSGNIALAVVPGEASVLAITAGAATPIAPAPAPETAPVEPVVTEVPAAPEPDPVEAPVETVAEPVVEAPAEPVTETPAEGGDTPAV